MANQRREEFTEEEARATAAKIGVDWAAVGFNLEDLVKGMKVELEHGTVNPLTNITNDDPILTAKIALAHLMEFDDYYDALEKMEKELEIAEEMEEDMEEVNEVGMKVRAANKLRAKMNGEPVDIY